MFFFVKIIVYGYYKWFDKRILKGALILMEEQGQPGEMNTVAEYNVLFDSVGINVCKLLLDDELTILWGNDNL